MVRRTTTKVAVSLPEETAPEHWLRTIRLSSFTVVMFVLLILAVIVLAPNLRVFIQQQHEIATLQSSVDDTQKSLDELKSTVARWDDPAYITSQARERLFYVFPGEMSYLVIGHTDQIATSDGLPVSDQIQTTKVDWLSTLLSSAVAAGLTDAPPAELDTPSLGVTP
ncbi:MAG: FtsB family cell division protein [Rhodoglobus sp.]